jgi:hypothetical protein
VPSRPGDLGPVQLIVIAFEGGSFDVAILDELRRLREGDAVRLIDLLFVAKNGQGELVELEQGDLPAAVDAAFGDLVRTLFGAGVSGRNGSAGDRGGTWFLADAIPAGTAAAVALVEHRWAAPLRDAIESADGHDLVDRWVHREDLAAITESFRPRPPR